ncbi:MAG: hypothetical protein R6V10_03165 [bacterium]
MEPFDHNITGLLQRELKNRPRGQCPAEETLAAYVEGSLAQEKAEEITGHLARCGRCLPTVQALRQILAEPEKEQSTRIPAGALEAARKLDPARRSLMEVVVGFAGNAARVLSMSESVSGGLVPAYDQVRKNGQVLSETLVSFKKDFDDFTAEVDVESIKPGRGEIHLRLADAEQKAPWGVRVTLYRKSDMIDDEDRELESVMLEGGEAVFENLRYGRYQLEIAGAGKPLCCIALEMKGEGK